MSVVAFNVGEKIKKKVRRGETEGGETKYIRTRVYGYCTIVVVVWVKYITNCKYAPQYLL